MYVRFLAGALFCSTRNFRKQKWKKTGSPESKVYDVVFVGKIDRGGRLKIFGFLCTGLSDA